MNRRFLNLEKASQPKPTKENDLKDFCLGKGLLRKNENWDEGLKESLEEKSKKVKGIYDRIKTSKSKKKKLELPKYCKETLIEGIQITERSV